MGDGWTDSKLKLTEIQLLDLVDVATRDGEIPVLWQVVRTAADTLVAEGLIKGNASHSGSPAPFLTPAGKALVLERAERRSDARRRAVACRNALLDWTYANNARGIDDFAGEIRAHFEGDPFTKEEIVAAARDLVEKDYLRVAWHRPQITAAGKTVVEAYGSSIGS